jgi:alpha-tubulin suppressor-like RCC1 family protein
MINHKGQLYTMGSNFWGQTGHGNSMKTESFVPELVQDLPEGVKVRQVACGFQHMTVLMESGEVFSCGKANQGALGIPLAASKTNKLRRLYKAHSVQGSLRQFNPEMDSSERLPDDVQFVACGQNFTIYVDGAGQVWSSGTSHYGELGQRNFNTYIAPTPVKLPRGVQVAKVACGPHHVVALTREGEVYTWGYAVNGQCGSLGPADLVRASPALQREDRIVALPGKVQLDNTFIATLKRKGRTTFTDCFAGYYDTVLITSAGEAVQFGGDTDKDGYSMPRVLPADKTGSAYDFGLRHAFVLR